MTPNPVAEQPWSYPSPEYLLAVSISHNSSAALMCNGEIVAAALEERFTRRKNFTGFPKRSIDFCLRAAGIDGGSLKRVAYTSTHSLGIFTKASTTTNFTIRDYLDYYGDRYYRRRFQGLDVTDYLRWLCTAEQFNLHDSGFDFSYLTDDVLADTDLDVLLFRDVQARTLGDHLGIDPGRVEFHDHHMCHAYYAYFGSPFRGDDCMVLTLDGWGDGRNMTVWRAEQDRLTLVTESAENDLGRIYKFATLILAMRPDEHEYKVMGLAPYAKDHSLKDALELIEDVCDVDGMRIVSKRRPPDLYAYLEEGWRAHRFDSIAGAAQAFVEQTARRLVTNIVRESGIARLVISGGICMNVKMNQAIAELPEVETLFVCGSGSDESLSIGGCYVLRDSAGERAPLEHLYLGTNAMESGATFDFGALGDRYDVRHGCDVEEVAALLERGDVVAVIRGRAEFGARALGNRSILAHPGRPDSVPRINASIKNRDFWMPFALSILDEYQHDYIINPKCIQSPFMTMTFDTRADRYSEIAAGTHPYDRTTRPQMVSKSTSPAFHRLLSAFHEVSGIPAVLNTSFNLHGEPIVDDVEDAVRTFAASDLDHLFVNDSILISKRAGSQS
jgi:carbamoyltransferase